MKLFSKKIEERVVHVKKGPDGKGQFGLDIATNSSSCKGGRAMRRRGMGGTLEPER